MTAAIIPPESAWTTVQGGRQKTQLLHNLVLQNSLDDLARSTAQELIRNLRSDQHRERLERIHRFVSLLPYYREAVETFQPVAITLHRGGDCDDKVLTAAALAWSLRYPFWIESVGDPNEPNHYALWLGYPHADEPWGTADTVWMPSETTEPTVLGTHWSQL